MRNRIKSKLKREMSLPHEKCKYKPTEKEVMYWFGIINREVFDKDLPPFREIEIKRRHKCWGECIGDTDKFMNRFSKLSINHHMRSKKHFIEVLVHEMVHHYQWIHENTMSHGDSFFSWKNKLGKFKVNLTVTM